MTSEAPALSDDAMYQLLRNGDIDQFNQKKSDGHKCTLNGVDLRGLDLRGIDARGVDFSNSYFRHTDLRGVDFTEANLEGASINGAKISGCLFPNALSAEEITLSLIHGTRMRYR